MPKVLSCTLDAQTVAALVYKVKALHRQAEDNS